MVKWKQTHVNHLYGDGVVVTHHVETMRIVVNLDHKFKTCQVDHPLLTGKYCKCYQVLSSGLFVVLEFPRGTTRKAVKQYAEKVFTHYENR